MKVYEVKHARKAKPDAGIAVGDRYYWWCFLGRSGKRRYSIKCVSKTYPRRSQLTRSAFLGALYDIEDTVSDIEANDSFPDVLEEIKADIQSLIEETQASLDNMPENLQQGETGQLLQERIEGLESWLQEIEGIDANEPDEETLTQEADLEAEEEQGGEGADKAEVEARALELLEEKKEEHWQQYVDELQGTSHNL